MNEIRKNETSSATCAGYRLEGKPAREVGLVPRIAIILGAMLVPVLAGLAFNTTITCSHGRHERGEQGVIEAAVLPRVEAAVSPARPFAKLDRPLAY